MRRALTQRLCVIGLVAVGLTVASVAAQEKKGKGSSKPRGLSSAYFCPKCSSEAGVSKYQKGKGECSSCKAKLVRGRLIWECEKCEKLNYRSAQCTKCKKPSKPVVVRWQCSKCEWGAAAPRKQCPKCKSNTNKSVFDDKTKFMCPKCKGASDKEGQCPHCKVNLEPKGGNTEAQPEAKDKQKT